MANYTLYKTSFNKDLYPKTINTSFSQITPPPSPKSFTMGVGEFFIAYQNIFYDIPIDGDLNSHAYLVKRSGEYIQKDTTTSNEDIQMLLDEINSLRQELLVANQKILELQLSSSSL